MNVLSFAMSQYGRTIIGCSLILMSVIVFVQSGWMKIERTTLFKGVTHQVFFNHRGTQRDAQRINSDGDANWMNHRFETAAVKVTRSDQNDSLKEALGKAAMVVSGKVLSTNIMDTTIGQTISEHDPLIRKAMIQVKQVLKGKKFKGTVTVYYASSDDVRWYQSPKPFVGQVAIFLLHSNDLSKQLNPKAYTLLSYLDVQELKKKSTIQKLL